MLRAAGVERAKIVAVCTQKKDITDRVVDLVLDEFPQARLYVRAYDRVHLLSLQARGIDYGERETFEGGLKFGAKALEGLGLDETTALELADETRERDYARLALQAAEGIAAGRDMVYKRPVNPEPLVKPRKREEQD